MIKKITPFVHQSQSYLQMSFYTLIGVMIPGILYALFFDLFYFYKILAIGAMALLMEQVFSFLNFMKFQTPSLTTLITSFIYFLSLPPHIPYAISFYGLFVSVVVIKLFAQKSLPLQINAALGGRLFLMLFFPEALVVWGEGQPFMDALTTATPLTAYKEIGELYSLWSILTSSFHTPFFEEYYILPPSPADTFPLITLFYGLFLIKSKMMSWRLPFTFLFFTFLLSFFFKEIPHGFYALFTGGILYSSFYVAGSPRHTPASPLGQYMAGIGAAFLLILYRKILIYPEVIVFVFLTINLLSPLLDKIAALIFGIKLFFYRK